MPSRFMQSVLLLQKFCQKVWSQAQFKDGRQLEYQNPDIGSPVRGVNLGYKAKENYVKT